MFIFLSFEHYLSRLLTIKIFKYFFINLLARGDFTALFGKPGFFIYNLSISSVRPHAIPTLCMNELIIIVINFIGSLVRQ